MNIMTIMSDVFSREQNDKLLCVGRWNVKYNRVVSTVTESAIL